MQYTVGGTWQYVGKFDGRTEAEWSAGSLAQHSGVSQGRWAESHAAQVP